LRDAVARRPGSSNSRKTRRVLGDYG